jgi:hypothetical protein
MTREVIDFAEAHGITDEQLMEMALAVPEQVRKQKATPFGFGKAIVARWRKEAR